MPETAPPTAGCTVPVPGRRPSHFHALTSLRFLAALLVMLFHFPPQGEGWTVVAGQGHVGVSVFFVLSGFLITARYAEGFARGELDLRLYFVRRMARILPLYYFVFVVSQLVSSDGALELAGRWPEWTLTQALFGESLHDFVIPTSWSLTVEECFYGSAPLVLLAVAAARRRWPRAPLLAANAVLAAVTIVLFAVGVVIWSTLDGRGPGFLREPDHVTIHTIFGRFYDFAVGASAALALAHPWTRVPAWLRSRGTALAATLVAAGLVYLSQWGMATAGGIEGPRWADAWAWAALLAPATALLIASLTSRGNPAARGLGVRPLVYLGKVSYALYLVQLTPIGRGFFYRFVSRDDGNAVLVVLFAGMTGLSALLYEVVEEPARRLVLRFARDPQVASERRPRHTTVLATVTVASLTLALAAGWTTRRLHDELGPPALSELHAAGLPPDRHVVLAGQDIRTGKDGALRLVAPPRRWREGWADDIRAPRGIHVYADGRPVPFSRTEPPGEGPAAFYRGPRTDYIALRLPEPPESVTLARPAPWTAVRVQLARTALAPGAAAAPLLLVGAVTVLLLLLLAPRGLRPFGTAS